MNAYGLAYTKGKGKKGLVHAVSEHIKAYLAQKNHTGGGGININIKSHREVDFKVYLSTRMKIIQQVSTRHLYERTWA